MDIYFIRHGQTEFNKNNRHQPSGTPLNETGRNQAKAVTPLIAKCFPSVLIASTDTRARETADIVNQTMHKELTYSDLFVELKRPNHIVGTRHSTVASVVYMFRWFFLHNPKYWKKVEGESRDMFLERIERARQYLEELPFDKVVVFSHSVFINFFIAHICSGKKLSFWQAVLVFLKIKLLSNSSISHLTYSRDTAYNTCPWSVLSFDEDSHVQN